MKTVAVLLKRVSLLISLYVLNITINGQTYCIQCVRDQVLLLRIDVARSNARRRRTELRGEYISTFPIGFRKTWRMA